MKKLLFLFLAITIVSCASKTANNTNTANSSPPSNAAKANNTAPPVKSDSSLGDPKSSIAYQFELVKAGDYENLKDCFTDRVKPNLTKEIVEKAKGNAGKYTMEDLFDSVEEGESGGQKTAKVKMKNGRTLTTLVQTNGKWLADTIWFN